MRELLRQLRALTRKELRALRPFSLFILGLFGAIPAFEVFVHDEPSSRNLWALLSMDREPDAWLGTLLGFGLGLAMGAEEHDRGTIAFLDMLPTTRLRVYLAKVLGGVVVLALIPVCVVAVTAPAAYAGTTSLDPSVHLDLIVEVALLAGAPALVGFAWGLALAVVRRLAWALLSLAAIAVVRLQSDFPDLVLVKPSLLGELTVRGVHLVVPWDALRAQGMLGLFAVFFGWLGFGGAVADRSARAWSTLPQSRRGRLTLAAVGVVAVAAGIGVLAVLRDPPRPPSPDRPSGALAGTSFGPGERLHVVTGAYELTVRAPLSVPARADLGRIDTVAARVGERFHLTPLPKITVDASSAMGVEAHLGQTEGRLVSMDARTVGRPDFLEILAHETAHVAIDTVSGHRATQSAQAVRTFDEGLATSVARSITGTGPDRSLDVAFARRRDLVRVEMLFDHAALTSTLGDELAYGLGELWVQATIDEGGPDAPIRVLRGLADAPTELTGVTLWRDAYQRASLDLDPVLARFWRLLDAVTVRHRARIDALPHTFATLRRDGSDVVIGVYPDRKLPDAEGEPVGICALRPWRGAPPERIVTERAVAGECRIPAATLPRGEVGVAVGLSIDGRPLLEAWQELPIR